MAMDNVGTYYVMGHGVAVGKMRAIAWYCRTAAHGYTPAMNNWRTPHQRSGRG